MHKEYNQSPRQVLEDLHAAETGLSGREAETRLGQYGPNRLREAPKATLFQRFIQQLKDPMLLILMAAAAVSAVTNYLSHEPFTGVLIILAVVLLNAVLGVVQESKAEAAIEALQTMTAATHQGTRELVQAIAARLAELPPVAVYEPEYVPRPPQIDTSEPLNIQQEDNTWLVEGPWLQRLMANINFSDYESRMYFDKMLRQSGLFDQLERVGIQDGDIVSMYNLEFEYQR